MPQDEFWAISMAYAVAIWLGYTKRGLAIATTDYIPATSNFKSAWGLGQISRTKGLHLETSPSVFSIPGFASEGKKGVEGISEGGVKAVPWQPASRVCHPWSETPTPLERVQLRNQVPLRPESVYECHNLEGVCHFLLC